MTEVLPEPDRARFPRLEASDLWTLQAGAMLGRIYGAGGDHPMAWYEFRHRGPTGGRFDPHPEPPALSTDHAVLYGAAPVVDRRGEPYPMLKTCLAEVYRDRGVAELRRDDPHFTLMTFARDLQLLDLGDCDWVTRAGGNGAISSGLRWRARQWARAIVEHYGDQVDGLIYPSSHIPVARAVALWSPAESAVGYSPQLNLPLAHPGLRPAVEQFAQELGLGVVV